MVLRRSTGVLQQFHRSVSGYNSRGAAVPPEKLQLLLRRCGLQSVVDLHGGTENFARVVHSHTEYQLFAPLFTPYFTIAQHQLTVLGDTTVDDFLTRAIMDYAVHVGLVLTVNATRQLKAVMHNHFTLRLFAKELCFDELAVPLEFHTPTTAESTRKEEGKEGEEEDALAFLQPQHTGLRGSDIAGTSFQHTPLRCGQSPLGWIFSHFVGAVRRVFGPPAARQLLVHAYGHIDANLPGAAAALLLRTLQHFPSANVAEALLAAQGLPHRVVAETRVLSDDAMPRENSTETTERESDLTEAVVVYSGQNAPAEGPVTTTAVNIDTLAANRHVFTSLAAGPGGIDAVGTWRQRAQRQFEKQQQQIKENEKSVDRPVSLQEVIGDDGWLSKTEQGRYQRGAAFCNTVHMPTATATAATYFADMYGVPQPVNGHRVGRLKFRRNVSDRLQRADGTQTRDGIPLASDGESTAVYINRLAEGSHTRLFDVSLEVNGRTAGRAVGTRYTVAREAACGAYIAAVLRDLHTMTEKHSSAGTATV